MPGLLAALRALAYAYHSNNPTNEPTLQLYHAKHRVTQQLRAVRVADDARLCEFCCVSGRELCDCRCRIHLFRRVSEVQVCVKILRTKKACTVLSLYKQCLALSAAALGLCCCSKLRAWCLEIMPFRSRPVVRYAETDTWTCWCDRADTHETAGNDQHACLTAFTNGYPSSTDTRRKKS